MRFTPLAATTVLASLLAVIPHSPAVAAPPQRVPTVQVAVASDVENVNVGETFHTQTVSVSSGYGTNVYLTGFADAEGPFVVDDVMTVVVTAPDGTTRTWTHDFSDNCAGTGLVALPPEPINNLLTKGLNRVEVRLSDRCGDHQGSSNIYLTGPGVVDPQIVGRTRCTWPTWAFGMLGAPAFTTSIIQPTINTSHRIEGSAVMNILDKVNCSTTAQFVLETKVCNRWGTNCNPRTMASSGVLSLPATGQVAHTLNAACRSGADSYRMRIQVQWTEWHGLPPDGDGLVFNRNDTPDGDAGWVKLDCG